MTTTKIKDITEAEILDRSKPPKAGKPKDINFPKFFEAKTENGITVLVIEDKRLPLVTTRFVFKSGSYLDYFLGKNKSGLASMTSELLTKGTNRRSATQIAEEVDYLGGNLSSGSDYDATYISSYSLKKYFDTIFDIASDVILNPVFAEDEINRSRDQRLNSLLSMIDDGDYLSDKIFKKIIYRDMPYAFPIEGSDNSIKELTKEDIDNFYDKVFVPENLIVAFVGDITPEEAMTKMKENFSSWEKKPVPKSEILISSIPDISKVYLVEKKGAVQSSLKIGHLGIKRNHPDYFSIYVMNMILGGYFTSRINKNLREVNGYTYGARSSFSANKYSGDFSITTEVKNEITSHTIKEILKEINDIKNDFVSRDELQNVKNYLSGNFPLQLETPNAIASKVINLKLNDLEDDHYNTYLRKINELTKEDIKDAAQKYLHPDALTISIAGNTKEIMDDMKQFGETEVFEKVF
ncbi:MAG: insulinase family protein [Bacteroidota bacterium]|nr:insulinase family protein [Bacteroidota bacterium]